MNEKMRILLYSSNIWYLGEGMLGPLFAVYAQKIGGSVFDITWAWAVYMIVTGVMEIIVGKMSDNGLNKEKLTVIGYALNAVFTFGYLFVSTPMHLFIVQTGIGIATALSTPTWNALYSRYEDKKTSGYTWGLAWGTYRIVAGIAIVIGGAIVSYYSFELLFITMGIIQVIATLYQAKILKHTKAS